jgi:hypothetical protein
VNGRPHHPDAIVEIGGIETPEINDLFNYRTLRVDRWRELQYWMVTKSNQAGRFCFAPDNLTPEEYASQLKALLPKLVRSQGKPISETPSQ